ncbi:hypothetical protein B0T20DRAFT_481629 [Sordaria brevicollis]|uniref:Uncharacterized protein n=1 Tax=Sordaria brevicollis TaxID=83679 RepID=A0AAE0UA74_SORBR|nr:hypothetical protein B0T20DRAFT_481629 [Sordaria brevicollis]
MALSPWRFTAFDARFKVVPDFRSIRRGHVSNLGSKQRMRVSTTAPFSTSALYLYLFINTHLVNSVDLPSTKQAIDQQDQTLCTVVKMKSHPLFPSILFFPLSLVSFLGLVSVASALPTLFHVQPATVQVIGHNVHDNGRMTTSTTHPQMGPFKSAFASTFEVAMSPVRAVANMFDTTTDGTDMYTEQPSQKAGCSRSRTALRKRGLGGDTDNDNDKSSSSSSSPPTEDVQPADNTNNNSDKADKVAKITKAADEAKAAITDIVDKAAIAAKVANADNNADRAAQQEVTAAADEAKEAITAIAAKVANAVNADNNDNNADRAQEVTTAADQAIAAITAIADKAAKVAKADNNDADSADKVAKAANEAIAAVTAMAEKAANGDNNNKVAVAASEAAMAAIVAMSQPTKLTTMSTPQWPQTTTTTTTAKPSTYPPHKPPQTDVLIVVGVFGFLVLLMGVGLAMKCGCCERRRLRRRMMTEDVPDLVRAG